MIYVEAPDALPLEVKFDTVSVFLAGGITGCSEWQKQMTTLLESTDLMVFNPRRENFPIHDPRAAEAQITWEYSMLRAATMISFWFDANQIQPIVLFELGAWLSSNKPIFIGVHPDYPRKEDVRIQTRLVRPKLRIVASLEELAQQIMGKP